MASRMAGNLLAEAHAVDHAIYRAVAETPSPHLDAAMCRLSNAANSSRLWLGIAAGLMLFGSPRQRRAAAVGVAAIAVTSVATNLVVKQVFRRRRPQRADRDTVAHVRMPLSASFPSGHSASAFAFATAVGGELPRLALPLRALATGVAYSRVQTGVHYPSDALVGSLLGAATGSLLRRLAHPR
jgi:membrane-associated phospholipid phosphatase